MRELRTALGILQTVVRASSWIVGTIWLGTQGLWKVGVLVARRRTITTEMRRCPRGHRVLMYGLWDCACGSRIEGWAFSRCDVCHETAAYVPCGVCGLPIRNPFLV